MDNQAATLDVLKTKVTDLKKNLKTDNLQAEITTLQQQTTKPDFWQHENQAKKTLKNLSQIQATVNQIEALEKDMKDLEELVILQEKSKDSSLKKEINSFQKNLVKKIAALELQTYFKDKYDPLDAILSVHAGQGGTEAMDWAAMLLRMYTRYCDKKDWSWQLINQSPGEEAGLKSATILVNAPYAYGYLKKESGTHRLVRQSPFNADNLRQTSFANIEVIPVLDDQAEINIKDEDLEIDFFRSGGPGGQNVNKVSTAVRIKHKPSSLVVESQTQRSQDQNRKIALQILQSKLWEIENQKRKQQISTIKGQHHAPSWGHQIRSYVLHPYKQVKDLRTQVESSDPDAVLDGQLDLFIEAELNKLT